ncbi:MAG TPA: DUF4266 domain-containing protein [Marinagarivorans sp.]|nr:DUF4266 domain-containing protein [Cellvibrionaceae bacterium]HMY38343.1 DUF4266 domain-containing protein [Marinagarivorans sp.]HNG61508.1 DUF4266 domain-containing protein [Cellvibrionaceae bacterium]
MPAAYLIDHQGRIRHEHLGVKTSLAANLRAQLKQLLNEPTQPPLNRADTMIDPWRLWRPALLTLLITGCTSVEPWQRGRLAKPQMAADVHSLQDNLRSHVHSSREAAAAGDVTDGGGCGCY